MGSARGPYARRPKGSGSITHKGGKYLAYAPETGKGPDRKPRVYLGRFDYEWQAERAIGEWKIKNAGERKAS